MGVCGVSLILSSITISKDWQIFKIALGFVISGFAIGFFTREVSSGSKITIK
jgi:hypothetical protein